MGTAKSTPCTPVKRARYWLVRSCMDLNSTKVRLWSAGTGGGGRPSSGWPQESRMRPRRAGPLLVDMSAPVARTLSLCRTLPETTCRTPTSSFQAKKTPSAPPEKTTVAPALTASCRPFPALTSTSSPRTSRRVAGSAGSMGSLSSGMAGYKSRGESSIKLEPSRACRDTREGPSFSPFRRLLPDLFDATTTTTAAATAPTTAPLASEAEQSGC
mmetsp:Transcript_32837/g.58990  ORF Transcript_32837/g.58990 Transcript_32837/m.58990 type:complete len:214 (+) Transcript_32837:186-827(+)